MALCLVLAAGCAVPLQQGPPPAFRGMSYPAQDAGVHQWRQKLEVEGERNWVLNLNELAVAAMRAGDRELAKTALDEAIVLIEAIWADTPQARRARSLFFAEKSKVFKGDPHERAMVFYYRGVLYMQDGEWDNARACFRSAILQDAFAEEYQQRGDWAIFDWLIGVCEVQLGNPDAAADAFARAQRAFSTFPERYRNLALFHSTEFSAQRVPPKGTVLKPLAPEDNLLVLVQLGKAPRKMAAGRYGEYLTYKPGYGAWNQPVVKVGGKAVGRPLVTDSVLYQAITRGGRELDALLGRKAVFKGSTEEFAAVSMVAGAGLLDEGLSHNNDDQAVAGAAILAAGFLSQAISEGVRPEADTRAWSTLPDGLGLFFGRLQPGAQTVAVDYGEGRAAETLRIPVPGRELRVLLAFPPAPRVALMAAPEARAIATPAPTPTPIPITERSIRAGDLLTYPPSPNETEY
ncbi:MAG: tetratricopeptide repeat protein [Sumerlaeia bacterium]